MFGFLRAWDSWSFRLGLKDLGSGSCGFTVSGLLRARALKEVGNERIEAWELSARGYLPEGSLALTSQAEMDM